MPHGGKIGNHHDTKGLFKHLIILGISCPCGRCIGQGLTIGPTRDSWPFGDDFVKDSDSEKEELGGHRDIGRRMLQNTRRWNPFTRPLHPVYPGTAQHSHLAVCCCR
jgi:hypothetical protein